MEFLIILLSNLGVVWILKYATILNFIRTPLCNLHPKVKELFNCALCLGFWVGCLHYFIVDNWVYYPFTSAAFCWFMDCLIDLIQFKQIELERKLKL